jgi:phenylpropionate dioxygenase-like ring-hydroxylating dioxygenase large terminal subunit
MAPDAHLTRGRAHALPQIGEPDKMAAAAASPRACVTSYPTCVVEGMLFAWLEAGRQAEKEAAANPPFIMPEQVRWCGLSCVLDGVHGAGLVHSRACRRAPAAASSGGHVTDHAATL